MGSVLVELRSFLGFWKRTPSWVTSLPPVPDMVVVVPLGSTPQLLSFIYYTLTVYLFTWNFLPFLNLSSRKLYAFF